MTPHARSTPPGRRQALPPIIAAGLRRLERERRASIIARPMRELFALLASGEVYEIDGQPVMRMPECDPLTGVRAEWCAIGPAVRGWVDCWQRIAPDIDTTHMQILADRLEADKPITPRLVERARDEFEATIARIPTLDEGRITSAIRTTQIAWELETLIGPGATL